MDLNINDYATSSIPKEARRSVIEVGFVAAAFSICMSGLFTGSSMASGLTLSECIFAALLGNTILAAYGGLMGALGAERGLSTAMLLKDYFGKRGADVISILLAVTVIGWYSVQTGFFGETVNALWPNGGLLTDQYVAAFWGGILMMITPYFGFRGLKILSMLAVPLIGILSLWGIAAAAENTILFSYVPDTSYSLGKGVTLAVGSFAVGAVIQADIVRYAESRRDAWLATIFGYIVANSYIIVAGAITTMASGAGDLPAAMIELGLGAPALAILILSQWTTNDNNLYSASLTLSAVTNQPKHRLVIICGVVATVLGAMGLADHFIPWLTFLGIAIPPIAGVVIAKAYAKRCLVPVAHSWDACSFGSLAVGVLLAVYLPMGIPAVNSILGAIVCQIALGYLPRKLGNSRI